MSSWITFNSRINLRHPSLVRSTGQTFVTAQPDRFQMQLTRVVAFGFALGWVLFW